MNWAHFPSLNGLRAFAAAAETRSSSRAGTSRNVSHAAVSQQVKALEARLGVALVIRQGRGIKLTDDGVALARYLVRGFSTIREGVDALTGADMTRPIQVTMSPAFAVSWLMPRIMDFQHQNPGLTLMLNHTAEIIELAPGGIDMAIRYGGGNWPEMAVTPLLLPDMVVVGARELVSTQETTHPAIFIK